jgi:hypothetical protein
MRRAFASFCVFFAAWCGATGTNTAPLTFGMTPTEAAAALGMPLTYHSGHRGSKIYIATGLEGVPGYYPVDTAIALQFRRNRLTGWKYDWRVRRPWPF